MHGDQTTPSESDRADSNIIMEENLEANDEGMNGKTGLEMDVVELEDELKLEIADEEEDEDGEKPEEEEEDNDNENIDDGKE